MNPRPKHPILQLISQGEGQSLDFKFAVNDSLKIARSLVAFANTHGGTLLIGVKDNGSIAGVRTDEEYYMLEAAANIYSSPVIGFTSKEWNIGGRKVLEVAVPRGANPPYYVLEANSHKRIYLRIADSNVETDRLMSRYLRLQHYRKGGFLSFGEPERVILASLAKGDGLSFQEIVADGEIRRRDAEQIIVNLLLMKVIQWQWNGRQFVYKILATESQLSE